MVVIKERGYELAHNVVERLLSARLAGEGQRLALLEEDYAIEEQMKICQTLKKVEMTIAKALGIVVFPILRSG